MAYGAYATYRNTAVQTASPDRLLVMLYDGLIRFIQQGRQAIEAGDVQSSHNHLRRAQDIVVELRNTLKMEYEISHALGALYDWFFKQLLDANLKKSVDPLDDILPRIEELRDAWVQAAQIARSEKGASSESHQYES